MIASKSTFTQIKLPQLSMSNLDRWRQSKPSIRSLNFGQDRSCSPPKTKNRTDIVSRGSMSTPMIDPKKTFYNFKNILKYDKSFSDQDLFSAHQSIDKLQRKLQNIGSKMSVNIVAARDPRQSVNGPYFGDSPQKQPINIESPSKRNPSRNNSIKKRVVKDKILDIYQQVKQLITNHKGYIRQADKKNTIIKLVQLKKEFKLLNQDYNDFYQVPSNNKFDYDLANSYEILKKLFESNKEIKKMNSGHNIFDDDDLSFTIPTETDENRMIQIHTEEIREQDEISQTQEVYDTQNSESNISMTSQNKSIKSNQRVSKQQNRTSKLIIQPIQVQDENIGIPVTPGRIRRKSSIRLQNEVSTPVGNTRNNRFQVDMAVQLKSRLPTPPQTPKSQKNINQEQQDKINQILKRDQQKRQSKLITRQGTQIISNKDIGGEDIQRKRSTQGIEEESEFSEQNMRQTEETTSNIRIEDQQSTQRDAFSENQDQIADVLNEAQSNLNQLQNNVNKRQSVINPVDLIIQLKNQQQHKQIGIVDTNKLIVALSKSEQIYDTKIINSYRRFSNKQTWDDDINHILRLEYQFRQ